MSPRVLPVLAGLAALLVLAAAPPVSEAPDELIRRANAAFLAGDTAAADPLYAAAEERTDDPGLVAFNKAAVLFRAGDFRGAELHYARTLDDRACPPDRAARAWFNRGTCLLRRGGSASVYRSAVACFDRCLDLNRPDEPLKADARHNLELAKLLWADANKKAAKPETPNAPSPEEKADPPRPQPGGPDPETPENGGPTGPKSTALGPKPTPTAVPKATPTADGTPTPGNNPNLPVLVNDDKAQPLSPEDTRALLRQTEERLRRERQSLLRAIYGADRPDVRDW